jgi:putative DNA primase/helicase
MMAREKYDFEALKRACEGNWASIISALSIPDVSQALATRKKVKCPPGHGGKSNRQFRVFDDFDQTGGGICNSCGGHRDGFGLLTYLNGWDKKRAVKEVALYMEGRGYQPDRSVTQKPRKPAPKSFQVNQRNSKALTEIWNEAKPIKGTLVEKYIRQRGIAGPLPNTDDVRFHPKLLYWDEDTGESLGFFPAMVSMMKSSKAGHPLTIHRTYLDPVSGKAKVPMPKKLMPCAIDGAISELGGAIRLYKLSTDLMAVAEGIETAMAVRSGHRMLPVWATYSASVMTNFQPPIGIKCVHIFGDVDASGTGQAAAARLALKLDKEGYKTRICLPSREIVMPADRAGWYKARATRKDLEGRLSREGYEITDQCPNLDWLDVLKTNPELLKRASQGKRFAA